MKCWPTRAISPWNIKSAPYTQFVHDVKLVSLPKKETSEAIERLTKIAQQEDVPEKVAQPSEGRREEPGHFANVQ